MCSIRKLQWNHGLAPQLKLLYGRRHDAQYAQPANAAWSESAQRTTVEQGGGYSHRMLRRPGGSVILNHHWPTWGNERIVDYWEAQRDMYRYLHDQTLHLANRGLTPDEIAEEMKLPASLASQFNCRGYYGTLSHNVKAQCDLTSAGSMVIRHTSTRCPPSELGAKYVEAIGGADKFSKWPRYRMPKVNTVG